MEKAPIFTPVSRSNLHLRYFLDIEFVLVFFGRHSLWDATETHLPCSIALFLRAYSGIRLHRRATRALRFEVPLLDVDGLLPGAGAAATEEPAGAGGPRPPRISYGGRSHGDRCRIRRLVEEAGFAVPASLGGRGRRVQARITPAVAIPLEDVDGGGHELVPTCLFGGRIVTLAEVPLRVEDVELGAIDAAADAVIVGGAGSFVAKVGGGEGLTEVGHWVEAAVEACSSAAPLHALCFGLGIEEDVKVGFSLCRESAASGFYGATKLIPTRVISGKYGSVVLTLSPIITKVQKKIKNES